MAAPAVLALACLLAARVVQSADDSSGDTKGTLKIVYSDHPHPASALPQVIHYQVMVNGSASVRLRLRRRSLELAQVPVFSRQRNQITRMELRNTAGDEIGFYQGEDLQTAVTLKIKSDQNASCHEMRGTFRFSNSWFSISPEIKKGSARRNGYVHVLRKLGITQPDFGHQRPPKPLWTNKLYSSAKLAGVKIGSGHPGPVRHKRQTQPPYDVGILVVVDYSAYKRIELGLKLANPNPTVEQVLREVRFYCAQVENQVDVRYRSIDATTLSISTTLKGIYVETLPSGNYWLDRWTVPSADPLRLAIDSSTALSNFTSWVSTNLKNSVIPSYDHASLFTGYDLSSKYNATAVSYGTVGTAWVGSTCTEYSESVVEMTGALGEGHTLAHELGHSLGATHDGEGNACLPGDQYIMTATSKPTVGVQSANTFHFSSCSQLAMAGYIAALTSNGKNCLLDDEKPYNATEWAQEIAAVPGQRYSASEQCKQVFGSRYSVCGGARLGSNICEQLWCYDTTAATLRCSVSGTSGKALDGTQCGDKKWCDRGACVYNSSAPSGSDTCPLGDITKEVPVFSNQPYTCSNMPAYYCYDSVAYGSCCKTCADRYNPTRPDCPYGDKADCSAMTLFSCRYSPQNTTCCGFCSDNVLPIPGCPFGDYYSNCRDLVPQICSRSPVECCATCAAIQSTTVSTTVLTSTTTATKATTPTTIPTSTPTTTRPVTTATTTPTTTFTTTWTTPTMTPTTTPVTPPTTASTSTPATTIPTSTPTTTRTVTTAATTPTTTLTTTWTTPTMTPTTTLTTTPVTPPTTTSTSTPATTIPTSTPTTTRTVTTATTTPTTTLTTTWTTPTMTPTTTPTTTPVTPPTTTSTSTPATTIPTSTPTTTRTVTTATTTPTTALTTTFFTTWTTPTMTPTTTPTKIPATTPAKSPATTPVTTPTTTSTSTPATTLPTTTRTTPPTTAPTTSTTTATTTSNVPPTTTRTTVMAATTTTITAASATTKGPSAVTTTNLSPTSGSLPSTTATPVTATYVTASTGASATATFGATTNSRPVTTLSATATTPTTAIRTTTFRKTTIKTTKRRRVG